MGPSWLELYLLHWALDGGSPPLAGPIGPGRAVARDVCGLTGLSSAGARGAFWPLRAGGSLARGGL
eukprot:5518719-Alexandrium_andersonii.AAC.1